jgi:hypothetical protein
MSGAGRLPRQRRVTIVIDGCEVAMGNEPDPYPWVETTDERFTLALVLDVGEVLHRHGYAAPTGATLVELTTGLYRALHPFPTYPTPPFP